MVSYIASYGLIWSNNMFCFAWLSNLPGPPPTRFHSKRNSQSLSSATSKGAGPPPETGQRGVDSPSNAYFFAGMMGRIRSFGYMTGNFGIGQVWYHLAKPPCAKSCRPPMRRDCFWGHSLSCRTFDLRMVIKIWIWTYGTIYINIHYTHT